MSCSWMGVEKTILDILLIIVHGFEYNFNIVLFYHRSLSKPYGCKKGWYLKLKYTSVMV